MALPLHNDSINWVHGLYRIIPVYYYYGSIQMIWLLK